MSNAPPGPIELPPLKVEPAGDMRPDQFGMLRQHPGYPPAVILIFEAIASRAEKVLLDYTRDGVAVRYNIDGMWVQTPGRDRMTGDALLMVLKLFAALNPSERRAKQQGFFKGALNKDKYKFELVTEGVKTGERVLLEIRAQKKDIATLKDLGMRDKAAEQLKSWMTRERGLILFSGPLDSGLRTTYRSALNSTDRFMRDFRSVEDKHAPEPDIINVEAEFFDSRAGQTAITILPKLVLREPDVVCVPELNSDVAKSLCELSVKNPLLTMTRIRAVDCVDALQRFTSLHPDLSLFAKSLIGVINQRLVRRLCQCKEAYQPPPQLLHKLGIPPGRVNMLYRERRPLSPEQIQQLQEAKQPVPPPCPQCNGVGYFGRVAIFEMLEVNDSVRQGVAQRAQADQLRELARGAGARSFQEEAILQVALGVTSITEAQRTLKG
ncbi:ATPase, T2SS/T4P/T4SS family [Lignipirellula cremea]|uniref:Type II secretion system protein E n=1 Tax=Lignipirellula cremea TaxID=2528010 RepID=A0A518DQ45_9BACT|nr:ATPase, T2SS/T4P/T4SS family [Lignipirellula cremea]QDU93950.1 Type II secretion system protein E [Lignipirellula cremea]